MDIINKWHNETIGKKVVESLKNNHFTAYYVNDRNEAHDLLLELIPEDYETIGLGGSITIRELDILDSLEKRGHKLLDHNSVSDPEEKQSIRRQQLISDCFLCSLNAVTLDGQIYNMDGIGNRISAITFGPRKVIMVAGINKITKDLDSARERIAFFAGPMNSKRLNAPNPCTETGMCMNCKGKERICNVSHIMHKKPKETDINIIIVGESLGF